MKTQYTDVVAEYLREVDLRLAGLPVLQRRGVVAAPSAPIQTRRGRGDLRGGGWPADLSAHIEPGRAERPLRGEAGLIAVLGRLGSPDVVAGAAYEEAGPLPPVAGPPSPPVAMAPAPRDRAPWVL